MAIETKTSVDVQTLPPFKRFIMSIGELPTSYLESMSYAELLMWFCNFLQEQVIPAVNNNAEATQETQNKVAELNALFIQLKNYVDDYFENLDVQDEIDNKIDEMVENGTFQEIITPLVQTTLNELSSDVASFVLRPFRLENFKDYEDTQLPDSFLTSSFFNYFKISGNGEGNYSVHYNKNDFKNTSTNTWYISPNGYNGNSGADTEHPKRSLNAVCVSSSFVNGDTVIVMDGIYDKTSWSTTNPISNSINIIAQNKGKVWIKTGDNHTYTKVDGYTNVYTVTRSAVNKIYDISKRDEGVIVPLKEVASISEVDNNPSSYYLNGSTVYLSLYDDVIPSDDTIDIALNIGNTSTFTDFSADTKIYIEGINYLDANNGCIVVTNNSNYDVYMTLKDCKIFNCVSATYEKDAFSNVGAFSICDHVEIYNCGKDGFNYHHGTNKEAIGIEINCTANNFGKGRVSSSQLSNNATTAHNNSEVIRVNGNYSYCNGGVVADIDNSKAIMYGCYIFDSYGRNYDVLASDNATIYMYDCYTKGSKANTNLLTYGDNAHIYYKNTEYDTKSGNVIDLDT